MQRRRDVTGCSTSSPRSWGPRQRRVFAAPTWSPSTSTVAGRGSGACTGCLPARICLSQVRVEQDAAALRVLTRSCGSHAGRFHTRHLAYEFAPKSVFRLVRGFLSWTDHLFQYLLQTEGSSSAQPSAGACSTPRPPISQQTSCVPPRLSSALRVFSYCFPTTCDLQTFYRQPRHLAMF